MNLNFSCVNMPSVKTVLIEVVGKKLSYAANSYSHKAKGEDFVKFWTPCLVFTVIINLENVTLLFYGLFINFSLDT